MRTAILQLKDLGRMPNESINDSDSIVDVIRSYDDLLGQIRQPISFEEAEVLVQIFPESSFYDLQWDLESGNYDDRPSDYQNYSIREKPVR